MKKNFANPGLIDELLSSDEEIRKLEEHDGIDGQPSTACLKRSSMLMAKGEKDQAEARKTEVSELKSQLSEKHRTRTTGRTVQ